MLVNHGTLHEYILAVVFAEDEFCGCFEYSFYESNLRNLSDIPICLRDVLMRMSEQVGCRCWHHMTRPCGGLSEKAAVMDICRKVKSTF